MRWSSLMAWMSVVRCNVFYGNDAYSLPRTTKPPSASWLHLSAEKRLLTAPLKRVKKYFPFAPPHHPVALPPTQKLYIHSSTKLIYVVFLGAADALAFELVALMGTGVIWNDLDTTPAHGGCVVAEGFYRESKAVAWNSACSHVGHYGRTITKPQILHPSEVLNHLIWFQN